MHRGSPLRRSCLFVLLVGLLLSVLPPTAWAEPPCWECYGPGLPDPCRNRLSGIGIVPGSGGYDVWFAGDAGTLLHFDGVTWTKQEPPTSQTLVSIGFVSASKGWAGGYEAAMATWNGSSWTASGGVNGNYYRDIAIVPGTDPVQAWAAYDKYGIGKYRYWNGTSWKDKDLFHGTVYGLDFASSSVGWAVGGYIGDGYIRAYDGGDWTHVLDTDDDLMGVSVVSESEAWAVGEEGQIYHLAGGVWSAFPSPTEEDLHAIDMVSASDGWIVGDYGTILRWNGASWARFTSPTYSVELRDVAMASAGVGWIVGDGGTILRWDGASWGVVVMPTHTRLEKMAMTPGLSGRDGWAVGSGRDLLHWNGSMWHPVASGISSISSYYCVGIVNAWDAWACGPGGRMAHWDGASWTEHSRVESSQDIAMFSATNGWTVGWGEIQHWDGASWSLVPCPTTETLYDMDALSANDIWAAGDDGAIVHYDGQTWSNVPFPTTHWISGIGMASADEGYAVGQYGKIFRWNGSAWTEIGSPATFMMRAVDAMPRGDETIGWAVGDYGQILWLESGSWTEACSPTGNDLWDVLMVSTYEAWAIGDSGVILHWYDAEKPGISSSYIPYIRKW